MARVRKPRTVLTPGERRRAWVKAFKEEGGAILNVYLPRDINESLDLILRFQGGRMTKTELVCSLIKGAVPVMPSLKYPGYDKPAEQRPLRPRKPGKVGRRRRVLLGRGEKPS